MQTGGTVGYSSGSLQHRLQCSRGIVKRLQQGLEVGCMQQGLQNDYIAGSGDAILVVQCKQICDTNLGMGVSA